MGGILFCRSENPQKNPSHFLQRSAQLSAYRGELKILRSNNCAIGIQARNDEAEILESENHIVAINGHFGSLFPNASTFIEAYRHSPRTALSELNNDHALLIFNKVSGEITFFTSLSMLRPLYFGSNQGLFFIASEIRQVNKGLDQQPRLDMESIAELLTLSGPILNPQQTEFVGVQRCLAPRLYQLAANDRNVQSTQHYWQPPECTLDNPDDDNQNLISAITETLNTQLKKNAAFSISGGLDSSTLWGINCLHQAVKENPHSKAALAYSLTFPNLRMDESKQVEAISQFTGRETRMINAEKHKASDFALSNMDIIDRISGSGTLHYTNITGSILKSDGIGQHILGIGPELWLSASPFYPLDTFEKGQWRTAISQAWNLYDYNTPTTSIRSKFRKTVKTLVLPPNSKLRSIIKPYSPPPWLNRQWRELNKRAQHIFWLKDDGQTYQDQYLSRNIWFHGIGSGLENLTHLHEYFGIELNAPFLDRAFANLAHRLPSQRIAKNNTQKGLLIAVAQNFVPESIRLQKQKVIHNEAINSDLALLHQLDDRNGWALVDNGFVNAESFKQLRNEIETFGILKNSFAHLLMIERFLRHYGT